MFSLLRALVLSALFLCVGIVEADNWMSELPDDIFVANLSIPGAHDAATGNGLGRIFGLISGDRYARTQDIDLSEQWAMGVRAFDLRPCTTTGGYLNVNHGIAPTNISFDDALYLLRDSIIANPSEFAIIHLLHASEGDSGSYDYETLLREVIDSDEMKDYLMDFHRNLTVGDMRGKILILYRDSYNTHPTGGVMTNWTGDLNWSAQTNGRIAGEGSGAYVTSPLYMQDYAETYAEGAIEKKVEGVTTMLDYSTTANNDKAYNLVWVFNFASAYSQVMTLFSYEISLADGYRENASYTNAAIVDYLQTHEAGPTGIIMADYVGVDTTQGDDGETYETKGKELIDLIVENNYLSLIDTSIRDVDSYCAQGDTSIIYDLQGRRIDSPQRGIYIIGKKKVVVR